MNSIKLKHTKTELQYAAELKASHDFIFESEDGVKLKRTIAAVCPKMRTAYVLNSIPDQGEDIYLILVDNETLLSVEVDRLDSQASPIVEHQDLVAYKKHLSKTDQIRLAVAIQLGCDDLKQA